ncbi:carbohydrate ABC transporter permease [Dactylosporangium sp. CS-033363]|uniref:carbohydrate ABC transporter permease n=1 Tax=Dactylosporangium sp. CS-033363 TaxID=3239935 RepID=UPI003D8D5BB8
MSTTALVLAVAVTAGAPLAVLGYLAGVERLLALLPVTAGGRARPWAWLLPPLALVAIFLVYPMINTVVLSLRDATSRRWVGLANYRAMLSSDELLDALRNNALWLVLLTCGCLVAGLLIAVLADRVRYEVAAKSVVVLPTAVSFVAGAVIWKFMYDYQAPGFPQTGTLNALLTGLTGADPVPWLVDTHTNNAALIAVGVWMTTGFATVVISAALKEVPADQIEAARLDGAGSLQIFRYVVLPHLRPTLVVVATLLAIGALKAFDAVYVMTNGNYHTDVIANVLYRQLFVNGDYGRASAVAVLLAALVLPVLVLNIRALRREEG